MQVFQNGDMNEFGKLAKQPPLLRGEPLGRAAFYVTCTFEYERLDFGAAWGEDIDGFARVVGIVRTFEKTLGFQETKGADGRRRSDAQIFTEFFRGCATPMPNNRQVAAILRGQPIGAHTGVDGAAHCTVEIARKFSNSAAHINVGAMGV